MAETRKKGRLPLKAYLLYLLLVSFLLTGVTFSRYVTKSFTGDAARVARLGQLSITENGVERTDNEAVDWTVVPGVDITKNAVVHFKNSELACYVFVEVEAPGFSFSAANGVYQYEYAGGWLKFSVETDWECFETAEKAGKPGKIVYYAAVKPQETFERAVLAEGGRVAVSPELPASAMTDIQTTAEIHIQATVVQRDGFRDAETAYAAVNR